MAMGTRKQREKQEDLWIAHTELASAPGHPFYQRLNELLEAERFDEFVEVRGAAGVGCGVWGLVRGFLGRQGRGARGGAGVFLGGPGGWFFGGEGGGAS